jgi:LuxR family maltose regulon positive regulatory protein
MARATPTIRDATLLVYEEEQTISLVVGSEQWFEWLRKDTSTIFSVHTLDGSYTARKERAGNRRGGWYWKAYRTYQRTLYRAYLGKPEDLTLARLNEIALTLSTRIHEQAEKTSDIAEVFPATHHQGVPDDRLPLLLSTKLHPPRLPAGLVERTRLLARLDTSFAYKLTLLVAPAGFGKTTLVNQWFAAHSTSLTPPAASWVSLDGSDNDPLRFWRSVMTICQRLLGQERRVEGQAALAALTAPLHSPFDAPPLEMALTRLLNALADPSSGGLLVLDDYHAINEPLIHETLAFFIDHLPTNVHVLLLSRTEPDFPLLRWRSRGELSELHGADLRFSLDETTAFLRQSLPVSLSEAALIRLDSSLEGWAAGLRLLSLTLSTWRTDTAIEQALLELGERADFSHQRAGGTNALHSSLLAYFVTEILDTQSEPMQHFLLHTSMLSRLCAPLCDAVTGGKDNAEQLEAVAQAGLFLEAMEGPGGWYRYHALFAEAMRREASRRLGEEVLRASSLRASSWHEQEGLLTEAIEAAWLAQDMERVARLIEQVHTQNSSSPQTMLRWLEQLPEAVLRAHPLLCFLFATELRFPVKLWFAQEAALTAEATSIPSAERARVETLLSMAEKSWRSCGEFSWIGGIWAHRALSALLDQEPFSSVVSFAQQALAFLPQKGALDRRLQMYRSSCLYFVGREKLDLGQIGEARQMLLQAEEDNVPPGNKFLAVDIHLMIGKTYLIQGELKLAQKYLRQALSDACELGDEKVIADALLELAWLAFEWNDLQEAEQQAHEALELAYRIHPQIQEELHDRAGHLAV